MKVTIVSIGDELLFGEIVDTNAPYLAAKLRDAGMQVLRHLTCGDREEAIASLLQEAAAGADAVVVTGGLGPTEDDLTARGAAAAFGRRLVLNEEALRHVREWARRFGREANAASEKQALLPAKALPLDNPLGTAPGFRLQHGQTTLFFLPGVPREMERMFEESVLTSLSEETGGKTVYGSRGFRIFGMFEPELDEALTSLPDPRLGLTVAYRPLFPEIEVKLRVEGSSYREVDNALGRGELKLRSRLGDFIVGRAGESLDEAVARMLRERGLTLSLAESCTGGLIAKRITDIPGSSDYFLEGAVTYTNDAKMRALKVPRELLQRHGAVSPQVAEAMAAGIRDASGSSLALAVTGVAGPGGTAAKPPGLVYIALADGSRCTAAEYRFSGDRSQVRELTAGTALDLLRRRLLSAEG